MTTKTSRISALLPTLLTEELKKHSKEEKITQSSIIQQALELWIKTKLDQDTKDLVQINFNDLPDENEWLEIQTKI